MSLCAIIPYDGNSYMLFIMMMLLILMIMIIIITMVVYTIRFNY